jgi:DMSO/TMAO reductase YedYZ molybdopterin-dependent catalytic subunit
LRVHGLVRSPLTLDLADLREFPRVSRRVTLECAGNGRRLMDPTPGGTAWELGATGTALFTGTRLRDILSRAEPACEGVDCVFTGADSGTVERPGGPETVSFQRSLAIAHARSDEPMLAWEMNCAPLTRDHGFPVRLVVPRFYAVASVKWLVDLEIVDRPFTGHFQAEHYMYRGPEIREHPVTTMRVRALVTSHADGQRIPSGLVGLEGVAWSGDAPIARVRVRIGGGDEADREDGEDTERWVDAELEDTAAGSDSERAADTKNEAVGVMTGWRCDCRLEPGQHELTIVATDAAGSSQPLTPRWNELGYGNNVAQTIRLRVS